MNETLHLTRSQHIDMIDTEDGLTFKMITFQGVTESTLNDMVL